MSRASLPIRVFIGLALAAVPMLLLGISGDLVARRLPAGLSPVLIAAGLVSLAMVWCLILAVVAMRALSSEARGMISLAERGGAAELAEEDGQRSVAGRLSVALDERNRQVASLAAETKLAPINGDPRDAAIHVIRTARRLTGDPTWALAVVRSHLPNVLPPGVYHGDDPSVTTSIGEAERWASTAGPLNARTSAARRIEGPWGAFLVVDVASGGELTAFLTAPWEGRPEPSAAELDLLSLLGQHAGMALEHALLYATVKHQADDLDRMSRIQSDFLRGVSHDLQTPLTSIRALASEMQTQPATSETARSDLDVIAYQADRLRRMVSQLLVVSRLEAGALTPRQEVLAVQPLLERTWEALRADRPFSIETSGPKQLAVADPDRLEQVLWALFDNATKYSPTGTPIAVHVHPAGPDTMEVRITDQGTGMDPASVARAFDQFYRADGARRLVPDGSGVGLYAARGLVEAMDGGIAINSSLGRGTTVTLQLPAERAEAEFALPTAG